MNKMKKWIAPFTGWLWRVATAAYDTFQWKRNTVSMQETYS